MSKRSAKKKPWNKKVEHPSMTKGRLVEGIVGMMQENPNVTIDRRAFLNSVGGGSSKREMDVLLTSDVEGQPVRGAIECKNQEKPVRV